MATGAANERVFSIDGHVVNSKWATLKEFLSEGHKLLFFNSALRKKRWSLTKGFAFSSYSVFQDLPLALKWTTE